MEISELNKLILQTLKKDENAFRRIVVEFQSRIYTLCYRMLGNEEDAMDAVQETFLKVWLHLHDYQINRSFVSWIYKIAVNQSLDMLKSRKRRYIQQTDEKFLHNILSDDETDKSVLQSELGNLIRIMTAELTPKERIVFTLKELEGLEVNEIEEITGLSPAKIKSNLYLARQNIKNKLKHY
jgi:RNA polymerase sigma-70 factor, ECF subfamily